MRSMLLLKTVCMRWDLEWGAVSCRTQCYWRVDWDRRSCVLVLADDKWRSSWGYWRTSESQLHWQTWRATGPLVAVSRLCTALCSLQRQPSSPPLYTGLEAHTPCCKLTFTTTSFNGSTAIWTQLVLFSRPLYIGCALPIERALHISDVTASSELHCISSVNKRIFIHNGPPTPLKLRRSAAIETDVLLVGAASQYYVYVDAAYCYWPSSVVK